MMLQGHSFKDGDVVYKYFLDSEADEKSFAKRYGLQAVAPDARLGDLPVVLYSTTPGFYVIATGKRAGVASTAGSNSAATVTPQLIVDIAKRVSVPRTEPTETGEPTDEREPE